MTTVGIVGSRNRDSQKDFQAIWAKFRELAIFYKVDMIVSGGCKTGADRFAEIIATTQNLPIKIHHPQWAKYGKAAGPIRNTKIVEDADVLIACAPKNKMTSGTFDTVTKFKKMKGEDKLYIV